MKPDLVHVDCTYGEEHTQGPIHRDAAASMIRAFRNLKRKAGAGCSVTRVLRTSHVVITTELGMVAHLTWAESAQRTEARLEAARKELAWRCSVL